MVWGRGRPRRIREVVVIVMAENAGGGARVAAPWPVGCSKLISPGKKDC